MADRRWIEEGFLQWQKVEISFANLTWFNLILLRPSASYNKLLGRVAFRILSEFHDGDLLGKYPTALRRWLFSQKSSPVDVWLDSKCASDWKGGENVGCR